MLFNFHKKINFLLNIKDNGSEILKIKNAHGNEEITALNMDDTQRRLFSAARDGSVKVSLIDMNQLLSCFVKDIVKGLEYG